MDSWSEAQYSVLGSVLIDSRCAALVLSETCEDDFRGPSLAVYQVIKSLFMSGQTIDPVIVASRLDKSYHSFLMQLMEITPTAANVQKYVSLCRDQSRLLRLRELGAQLAEADSMDTAGTLLEQANKATIQRTGVRVVTMEEAMADFFERHSAEKTYLTWPIAGLDGRLFAELGDFIVIGGRPSAGKSALAIQFAYHLADKYRVGFFSLETSCQKIMDRLMAHAASIPMDRLKTNKFRSQDWDFAAKRSDEIIDRSLSLIPAAGMTVQDIHAVSKVNRFDVIFVDYLQLVSAAGRDRFSQVTEVSIGLHTMAQSSGIAVFALAQLSRGENGKKGGSRPPDLSDLRESGQIEQDADIVFMLHQPDPKNAERTLLVRKNKEGELGSIALDFEGITQTFFRKLPVPNASVGSLAYMAKNATKGATRTPGLEVKPAVAPPEQMTME